MATEPPLEPINLEVWERFTPPSRRAVLAGLKEAGILGESSLGPEHVLLGLLQEADSTASRALEALGENPAELRTELISEVQREDRMQLSPQSRVAFESAYREARYLNEGNLDTEHLLLGILQGNDNLAVTLLKRRGIDTAKVRKAIHELKGKKGQSPPGQTKASEAHAQGTPRSHMDRFTNHYGLRGTCLLSAGDLSRQQILGILEVSRILKQFHRNGRPLFRWQYPESVAMVFEKPSLRTRVTFELGLRQLGGIPIVLGPEEIGIGTRESVEDAARNLERWVDGIMARVFDHNTLVGLAQNCKIPVINGLSDREHPCQALTDLFTIQEKKEKLEGLKLAYVGDGNNVLHSLLLGGALVGMSVLAACPKGYEPDSEIVEQAKSLAGEGVEIRVVKDPAEAVKDADVVYTDVWTSMGQEAESATRVQAFQGYQITSELMGKAKTDAIFMHCLPAHRGEEVSAEVIDGPQSVVFDQAENRLHVQKAIMALLLGA